jgi:two-component sensor histidine kinase
MGEVIIRQFVDTIPAPVSLDNPTTLGLQLVRALTLQLDGTLAFETGKESTVRLRFPLEGQG